MLVSIVIPCYNSEHTIGKVVELAIEEFSKMKGYECEISIGLDDDIYHLYMDGTVYGDTSKLEQLFNKLLTEI